MLLKDEAKRLNALSLAELAKDRLWEVQAPYWHLDYSYERADERYLQKLLALWQKKQGPQSLQALLKGELVNTSEAQKAWHVLLRQSSTQGLIQDQKAFNEVQKALSKMERLCTSIHQGTLRTFENKPFKQIVHVGIGGSLLGSKLAYEALGTLFTPQMPVLFLANVDWRAWQGCLSKIDPKETLFIVASKSMTTPETLENLKAIWAELGALSKDTEALAAHIVTVTARPEKLQELSMPQFNTLPLWDWVGGRFSLWSAVGLPVALAYGFPVFKQLLAGAESMDQHFFQSPPEHNLPLWMALLTYGHRVLFNYPAQAILAYHHGLASLPCFLQQLEMESGGKCKDHDGKPLLTPSAPLTFGSEETNAQHSFHQMLHQGTDIYPADFILPLASEDGERASRHQRILIANALAQREALCTGQTEQEVKKTLLQQGLSAEKAQLLSAHKHMLGGRPSRLLTTDKLGPASLGALLAAYEHKTAALATLIGYNAFDQWGVELGKKTADRLEKRLLNGESEGLSASLQALFQRLG